MNIDNKKYKNTQIYVENSRRKKKNQVQRRKIIHYIKNWYKREEYQMITIYIGDKKYIIDKKNT